MKRSLPPLAVLLACACLPFTKSVGEASPTEDASSSDDDTSPPGTTETPTDPSASSGSTTGSGSTDETTGEPTEDPPSFACPPQQDEQQCDPLAQDCPGGFHCVPWSDDDEFFYVEAFVCAPLEDDPAGLYEECTSDPATCSDGCELGTYCFPENDPDDPARPGGLCMSPCSVDGDNATCSAGEACVTCSICIVGTCMPSCDPLAPQCPDGAPACVWMEPDGFVCAPAEHIGDPIGQECEFVNVCAEGLVCADAAVYGPSCGGTGCCTEICDLVDGDPACSNPAHECIPFYLPGTAPAGAEHLGMCGVP